MNPLRRAGPLEVRWLRALVAGFRCRAFEERAPVTHQDQGEGGASPFKRAPLAPGGACRPRQRSVLCRVHVLEGRCLPLHVSWFQPRRTGPTLFGSRQRRIRESSSFQPFGGRSGGQSHLVVVSQPQCRLAAPAHVYSLYAKARSTWNGTPSFRT